MRGCVVIAESSDLEANLTAEFDFLGSLRIRTSCVSDAEGRFRFPPLLGHFVVSLKNRDDVLEKDSEAYRRAIDPPPMVPVALHLDAPGEQAITLTEAPSAMVQGTVRWQDGRPAAGVRFYPQSTPQGACAGGSVASDKDGRYALRLPLPLEDLLLTAQSYTGPDAKGTAIWPVDPKHRRSRNHPGSLQIHPVDGPRSGLDWVIVPRGERPGGERTQAAEPDEQDAGVAPELLALEREIAAAPPLPAAGLDPNPDLIRRCLEFEAKHRGTRAGLGALHHVLVIGGADPRRFQGRSSRRRGADPARPLSCAPRPGHDARRVQRRLPAGGSRTAVAENRRGEPARPCSGGRAL